MVGPLDPDLAARLTSLDARVRARAGLEIARRLDADPSLAPILAGHLGRERDEEALTEIVRELPEDAALEVRAACAAQLERAGPELRAAILDRVLAWTRGFPESLRARVPHETEPALRGRLIDAWLARAEAAEVVSALADAPYPVVADALARARPGSIPWDVLAPIVERAIPVLEPLLLPHLDTTGPAVDHPLRQRLLANVVARALEPAVIGAPLRHDLASRALGLLDPLFDRPGIAGPLEGDVHRRLLGAAERIAYRADPDRLDPAEHELLGRVARVRRRAGTRDPRGWLGAALVARRDRGPTTVIEHAVPDGTATILFAVAGLELRALRRDVRALASALPDVAAARPLLALGERSRELALDAGALSASLARAIPPAPALADDLARLAETAIVRGTSIRAEHVEGWIEDRLDGAPDRPTSSDGSDPPTRG